MGKFTRMCWNAVYTVIRSWRETGFGVVRVLLRNSGILFWHFLGISHYLSPVDGRNMVKIYDTIKQLAYFHAPPNGPLNSL